MAKMTIMIGLPACGKSTKAKELISVGNTVRINKDLMREMLHFNKFSRSNDMATNTAAVVLAQTFLDLGINVIIDDTNLNPKTLNHWKETAKVKNAKIEYVDMTDVPVETCVARDNDRRLEYAPQRFVGPHVIKKMAMQRLGHLKGQKVIICDLDGTLCDCSHRQHFVNGEKKDWDSFFKGVSGDLLKTGVLGELYDALDDGMENMELVLVSGRPERCRRDTEKWLRDRSIKYEVLIMREDHDSRPDTVVKAEIYDRYLAHLDIVRVFDDRPSVIRMWREKGLQVVDVGDGVEF